MLTQVIRYLDEYQEKYRRPDLPALELRGMYALFPEEGLADFVESGWGDPFPNADSKGVYLIFGRTGMLLYVGKASMGATLGGRLGTHFAGTKECRLLSHDWTERPAFVATIAVPEGMSFEAAALEEYLIKCLSPGDNKLGLPDQAYAGATLETAVPVTDREAESRAPASSGLSPEAGVYTYSAPGLPMCPNCGQRPAIFYCSTHLGALCLECVARHDVPGECIFVPAYRAPNPAEGQAATPGGDRPPGAAKPRSILGID